jgi:hypothetical protein
LSNRNRTTAVDGTSELTGATPPATDRHRPPLRDLARAMLELVRAYRDLRHVPTRAQVRALAQLQGRAVSSYRLDPSGKDLPELPRGLERALGRHALCFTADVHGQERELVMLPTGAGFDRHSGLS